MTEPWAAGLTERDVVVIREAIEAELARVPGLALQRAAAPWPERAHAHPPGSAVWRYYAQAGNHGVLTSEGAIPGDTLADEPPGPDRDELMRDHGRSIGRGMVKRARKLIREAERMAKVRAAAGLHRRRH